jgi:(p)ppGpp synthase/HD superfamily hydrolase
VNVLRAVYPDHKDDKTARKPAVPDEGWFGLKRASGMKFRIPGLSRRPPSGRGKDQPIPIRGLNGDMGVKFAGSGAVPGERIVGIMTPGEGITIFPIQSQALKAFDDQPERWLDVRWDVDPDDSRRFPTRIEVTALNEPGSLVQVAQVISAHDANIANITIPRSASDFSVMVIDVEVKDVKHLNRIIAGLRTKPVVSGVTRVSA